MNRRTFLSGLSVSIATVAGCSGDGDDGGDGADPNNQEDEPRELISDSIVTEEDEYYTWDLTINSAGTFQHDVIVRDGPNIDFIVFEPSEFEAYENQERARYLSGPSKMDMANYQGSAEYPEGEYKVVVDNTDWGEAAPPSNLDNDPVEVEITITG